MFGRARRQRRRLALCGLLGAAAGALLGTGTPVGLVAASVAGGATMAAIATAAVVAAPSWRWSVLKLGLVALIAASVWRLAEAPPGATLLAAAAALLFLPSQPGFLDRLRLPFIARARVERWLPISPRRLWQAVRPRESDAHWDPFVRAVRPGPSPDCFVFVYRPLDAEDAPELPVRVFDLDEGRHFKTRNLSLPDAGLGGPVTVTSFVLEPRAGGTLLVVMEATWRQGLWTAFALWLDDYLADHVDRMAALLDGRPDPSIRGAMLRCAPRRRP